MTLTGIISFILVIGAAILIHEIGHFIAAGKFGVLRHEFSIGMGPALWKKRKGETLYTIRAIPIGGYVAMAGEDVEKEIIKPGQKIGISVYSRDVIDKLYLNADANSEIRIGTVKEVDLYKELKLTLEFDDQTTHVFSVKEDAMYVDVKTKKEQQIAPYDRCLESKSKFARFSIMVAGAVMNFILAFALVLVVGLRGEPFATNQIGSVTEGMPAQMLGLEVGDTIIEYNGYTITNAEELSMAIRSTTEEASITFIRDGKTHQQIIAPNVVEHNNELIPQIGIAFATEYNFSLGFAIEYAISQFIGGFALIALTLEMLTSGQAGIGDLSGPVGIAAMTTQVAAQGILPLLVFASFININLGIINLLPLPAMDGGRIVFVLIEAIIGRPVNRKIEGYVHFTGFVLFMGLTVFILYNDIIRLIQ